MDLRPTGLPLSVKSHDSQEAGFCPYCSCGCSFIAYIKNGALKDVYGHPGCVVGMGSLCTKGITYLQDIVNSPFRLKGFYMEKEAVSRERVLKALRENIKGKRVAFILTKQASLEDFAVAKKAGEVFVDAPLIDFESCTLELREWAKAKLIISIDAEPTLSDVMAMRFVVDAIEAGARVICISARYETLCAKAHDRVLLNLGEMVKFLDRELEENGEIAKLLKAFRGALVLIGAHLFLTPARAWFMYFLKKIREMGANYAIVGDMVRYKARHIGELFERLDDFDTIVSIGNGLRYFSDQEIEKSRGKFLFTFSAMPDFSVNVSNACVGISLVPERDFSVFRGGLRTGVFSKALISPQSGCEEPWRLIAEAIDLDTKLEDREVAFGDIKAQRPEGFLEARRWLYSIGGLCEELGHWSYWTHGLEPVQTALVSKDIKEEIPRLGGIRKVYSANIAKGVVFLSPEFDEYQPFFEGVRPGAFQGRPFYLVEALD
ncbi:MAG: hypothetical protein ABDH18_02295 [Aquificaceae bacterium]